MCGLNRIRITNLCVVFLQKKTFPFNCDIANATRRFSNENEVSNQLICFGNGLINHGSSLFGITR